MFSFVFYLCFVLQPILYNNSVFGRRESLKRYIFENGAKPAIFGSYSYDPVRQVFVPPKDSSTTTEHTTRPHHETEAHGDTTADETNSLYNHDDDKKNDDNNQKHDDDNKKYDDGNKKHDDDNKKHDDDNNNRQHDSSNTPEFGDSSTIGISERKDSLRKDAGQI